MDEIGWLIEHGPRMGGQVLVAAICGVLAGYERELHRAPAGMKTCMLVCVGASQYTHVGAVLYAHDHHGDPARMASQIVTGIGFLGAGAILHGDNRVTGLTTAATIWFIGGVGVIIGSGYPLSGFLLTMAMLGMVTGTRALERRMFPDLGKLP